MRLMTRFFSIIFYIFLVLGCSQESQQQGNIDTKQQQETVAADVVIMGGKVATVDPNLGNVEALAINGYQITAVGSNEEISSLIGSETKIVELNGRFAMPGFIEGHGHYLSLGRSKQILDLNDVKNWNEIVSMVAVAVDKANPGDWILVVAGIKKNGIVFQMQQ